MMKIMSQKKRKQNKTRKIKKYKGFTLIELMVVISIIGIMTAVGLTTYNSSKSSSSLKASQRTIATAIKLAQSYALQGRTQDIGGTQKSPCGYGIKFLSNNEFVIFYNKIYISSDKITCEDVNSVSTKFTSNVSVAERPNFFKYDDESYLYFIQFVNEKYKI